MKLTLGQASKECGKSKSTLLNAIKKGRLSAERSQTGNWEIDPAELFRVYNKQLQSNNVIPLQNTPEIELYKQQIADLKQQVIDWKAESEKWSKQAQQLAITNQSGGFWSFMKKKS